MPSLNFEGLPEYVTTSEEEEEADEQYQDGYNYIDNFYKQMEEPEQDLNEAKVLKWASEVNSFGFANSSELRFSSDRSNKD